MDWTKLSIATTFSVNFVKCFEYTVEPLESPIDIASPQSGVSVSDVDFIENEIRVILQKLKETTSPGSDDICAAILKECASALERPQSVKGRNSLIY